MEVNDPSLSQIEDRFSQLSIPEQLRLIERLVHRVHEQTVKAGNSLPAQPAPSEMPKWLAALWPTQYEGRRNGVVAVIGFSSALAYVITVAMITWCQEAKPMARIVLILWAVLPPVWFWFEYFILWKPSHPATLATYKEDLDMFKHGQEISRNIWLAFVATISLLYFKG